MKIMTKPQLKELMKLYPDGGIVFREYEPDVYLGELEVTDGDFGATMVLPWHGEEYDYDWNIEEYRDTDLFAVFDNEDVLFMIHELTKCIALNLKDDERYN